MTVCFASVLLKVSSLVLGSASDSCSSNKYVLSLTITYDMANKNILGTLTKGWV